MELTRDQNKQLEKALLEEYVSKKEHPTIKNLFIYTYTTKAEIEEIWDDIPIVRLCRGLVLYKNKVIINSMPKFFNHDTKFAPKINIYDEDVEITEKEDGYLIQIQNTEEFGLIVTSKGSFDSKYAEYAKEWVKDFNLDKNMTYICELCKDFKGDEGIIVTKHQTPKLVLITIRDREGNEYNPNLFQNSFQFTIIKKFTPEQALQYLNEEVEGIVLFDKKTYNRVKVKTDWFFKMHKLISQCTKKHVLEILKEGKNIQDLPIPDEFLHQMLIWQSEYIDRYNEILDEVYKELVKTKNLSDKELGLSNNPYKSFLFAIRKDKDVSNLVWRAIDN